MILYLFVIFILSYFFLKNINNLMFIVLLLEVISFWVMFIYVTSGNFVSIYFISMIFFSLFVLEGVISLVGLLSLVSFTGTDYISLTFF